MGIRAWLDKLRRREDAAALERAEDLAEEPGEERVHTSTDVEGLAADERAGRIAGETPEDVERLGG
ncbi:MAG TPA: hypothetical protein VE753_10080 [Gaiellaceae bacterium]|jgi:predicted transcriptional regulator|nr:hypothetical protein [Gaiellaceae bacterium]